MMFSLEKYKQVLNEREIQDGIFKKKILINA